MTIKVLENWTWWKSVLALGLGGAVTGGIVAWATEKDRFKSIEIGRVGMGIALGAAITLLVYLFARLAWHFWQKRGDAASPTVAVAAS